MLAAIAAAAGEVTRYPDGNGFALKAALTQKLGVDPEQIVLGNGSNDILELATQAYLRPGDEAIYAQHAFAVYPLATRARGATGVEVPAAGVRPRPAANARGCHYTHAHDLRRQSEQSDWHVRGRRGTPVVHCVGAAGDPGGA